MLNQGNLQMNGLDLIKKVCARHKFGDDGVEKVVDTLLWLGGYDMHELSREMILLGLAGAHDANWEELRWSMNEVCSAYATMDYAELTTHLAVGALVVAVILAQTTRMNLGSGYELSSMLGALKSAAWELPQIDVVETLKFVVNELGLPTE